MTSKQARALRRLMNQIHETWREDMAKLVTGGDPSQDFMDHFDTDYELQAIFDRILVVLDDASPTMARVKEVLQTRS